MNTIKLEDLKNMIKDKNVALIGPAEYVMKEFDENHGKYIDSFDIVIKLNNMITLPTELEKYYGSRCDILISAFWPFKKDFPDNFEKDIINNYERLEGYLIDDSKNIILFENRNRNYFKLIYNKHKSKIKNNIYYSQTTTEFENKCDKFLHKYKKNNKVFTTGLLSISNILNMNPKKLYISGMTTNLDKKYKKYYPYYVHPKLKELILPKSYVSHNINTESIVFKDILKNNNCISFDKYIQKIIS